MRYFKLNKEVDVVLNWFTSFGYFDDKDNFKTLQNFYQNLRNGGILILEFRNMDLVKLREKEIEYEEYEDFVEIGDIKVEGNYLVFDQKFYSKKGRDLIFVEEVVNKVRAYGINELKEIVEKVNFKILEVFETLTFKNFDKQKSGRLTLIARK